MSPLQCMALVLAQLGAGALLFTSFIPARQIRASFFTFQSLVGAVMLVLAATLGAPLMPRLVVFSVAVICAVAAAWSFRNEKLQAGRLFLLLGGMLGVAAVLINVSPLMCRQESGLRVYPLVFALAGFLLVGASQTAMVLGHWYLLMRGLSFDYLIRLSWLVLAAGVIRATVIAAIVLMWSGSSHSGGFLVDRALHDNSFFFAVRLVMGVLAPLAFSGMALRCAYLHANQAATGLLYLSMAFVFFGEMFAAFLML